VNGHLNGPPPGHPLVKYQLMPQGLLPAPAVPPPPPRKPLEDAVFDENCNLPPSLAQNIKKSAYLEEIPVTATLVELLDRVRNEVEDLEPLTKNRTPSICFILLYRISRLRVTKEELEEMLWDEHKMVKGLAILLIRFTIKPKKLYQWYKKCLHDVSPIESFRGGVTEPVWRLISRLLQDTKYNGLALPKIPVPVHRAYRKKMKIMETQDERNAKYISALVEGAEVRAMYHEDSEFYTASIESKMDNGNFKVYFTDYDETQTASLGQLRLPSELRKKFLEESRSRGHRRSRSRSRGRSRTNRSNSRNRRSNSRNRRSRSRDRDRNRRRDSESRSSRQDDRRSRRSDRDRERLPRSPSASPDIDAIIRKEDSSGSLSMNSRRPAPKVKGYKMSLCNSEVDCARMYDPAFGIAGNTFTRAPLVSMSKREIYGPSREKKRELKRKRQENERKQRGTDKFRESKGPSREHLAKMAKLTAKYGNAAAAKR